jgi:hypothetical protein
MSIRSPHLSFRPVRLLALTALAAGAMLTALAFGSGAAHADEPEPPGFQRGIVVQQLGIYTDQQEYRVGSPIKVCYFVPGPGYIQILDRQGIEVKAVESVESIERQIVRPEESVKVLLQGYDDGRGDCFHGVVTPPYGKECLTIRYFFWQGGSASAETCFHVLPEVKMIS